MKELFGIEAIDRPKRTINRSATRKKSAKLRKLLSGSNGHGAGGDSATASNQAAMNLMAGMRARAKMRNITPKLAFKKG